MEDIDFLECEKRWVYAILMMSAGFLGAFTYCIRGGVFCNAQTANFVLFAMALGQKHWMNALYYVIPMSAYLAGAIISEAVPEKINGLHILRWDTILVGIEIIVVIFLGFLPESAPFQISQVAINFICSMQYNTFRQAQRIPMATTFCTNHLRQTGIHIVKWFQNKEDKASARRAWLHVSMLLVFVAGGVASTILCQIFLGKAVWGAAVLLGIVFVALMHADLTRERELMERKPAGH